MDVRVPESNPHHALNHPLVQALLQNCFDSAIVMDAKTQEILQTNTQAERLLGTEGESLVGRNCSDVIQTAACAAICPLKHSAPGTDLSHDTEVLCKRKELRQDIPARSRMVVVRDTQGNPILGIEFFRDLSETYRLQRALQKRRSLSSLVGLSAGMQRVYEQIQELSDHGAPLVVSGENGSGRGRIAEVIHGRSSNASQTLTRVSCSDIQPEMVECTLLGHRADEGSSCCQHREGTVDKLKSGTLLIEDVDLLPLEMQARIAEAVQARIQKGDIGSADAVISRFRLVVTMGPILETRQAGPPLSPKLWQLVKTGHIEVPSLRDRLEDIPTLAEQILGEIHGELSTDSRHPPRISDSGIRHLMSHDWPGNLSEFNLVLREALVGYDPAEGELGPEALALHLEQPPSLADAERTAIRRAMAHTGGNLSAAARILGIDRTTLWRKLKRHPSGYQETPS